MTGKRIDGFVFGKIEVALYFGQRERGKSCGGGMDF
jgi:hypothetical protein